MMGDKIRMFLDWVKYKYNVRNPIWDDNHWLEAIIEYTKDWGSWEHANFGINETDVEEIKKRVKEVK